jgi:hypothetical protein
MRKKFRLSVTVTTKTKKVEKILATFVVTVAAKTKKGEKADSASQWPQKQKRGKKF